MKKGLKRGFAACIALLMLGCQVLPSIGTIASGNGANENETIPSAYVKYDFDDMDLSTMTEATSTMFEKNKNVTVSGEVDQAVSKHWWAGTTYNSQVSPTNRRNNGIKPKNHDTNTYRLDLAEGSENFELTTKIYYKDCYGIVFGKKNVYPDANGSYGAAYVNFGPITNGAIDLKGFATLLETGADSTLSGTRVTVDKLKQNSSTNNVGGCLLTLHIKVLGSNVEVWLDEYDVKIQGTLSDSYEIGTISLTAKEYKGGGGFKSVEIMKYDVSYDFDNMDLTTMTEATSTMFEKNKNVTVSGEVNQAVSKHWWTGTTYNSQVSPTNRRNNGIKPKNHDTNTYRLDLAEGSENFELTTKIYYKDCYGIVFGKKNVYPDANGSYGAAYVNFGPITNGAIDLKGFATLSETGADSTLSGTRVTVDKLKQNSSTNNVGGCLLTLHIKVTGSNVEVWLDEYDVKIQGTLSDSYEIGTISLTAKEYKGGGGFKAIWIKDWTPEQEVEIPATPAVVGDAFEKSFVDLSSVTALDEEFASYYFASNTATATKGKPSEQWAVGTSVYTSSTVSALRNNWLKPTHKASGTKHTLLTYKSKIFTNVEVEAEYVTNHLRYGVMIAPEAQLSNSENGVRVYVDGSGLIKIEGAIDAGTATATGGYVYVGGKNILSGYAVPGYVKASSSASNASNCTSYTIHIRITGKVMQVWLNECPTYVISVQLTDAYTGGMVSLYSTGNDHGAFKSFKAIENEGTTTVEDSSVFTQSFNTITSTDELKDKFDAYTLGASKTETPVATDIEDVYRVTDGMLKSNLTKAGTDYSDFGILTLKNKRYENFELTLKYVQDPNRYAVMIGTELGEFAFAGDSSHVNGNGGVLVYTEMEGYRNIKGSLYASSYTNAKVALHKKTENPKLESFVAFKSTSADKSDVLTTLEKKPMHTMTIRVVDGYLTMIVDNDEKSRVTVRLADYDGGYISLVTNVNKNLSTSYGGVVSLAIKELDDDAELNTTLPETGEEFETIKQVEKLFDAYYLENVKESSKLKQEKLKDRWWLNKGGFLTRVNGSSAIDVNGNMDILTYKKEQFTDFELTYSYQQTYQRTGILIGGDLGEYVLSYDKDGKLTADKGALLFIEAEGIPNVKGHLKNYTVKADLLYRTTTLVPEGFTNAAGSASEHVNAKTEHVVKVVVKDKKLYVFLDGCEEPSLYVKLGDDYKGGYISIFSSANNQYGIGNFSISDKITTKLPEPGGVSVVDNTLYATFDTAEFDDSLFATYYLDAVKNNENGAMKKAKFEEQWTVANNVLKRTSAISNGSDEAKVSVLTYDQKLTDFVATYEYQQDSNRLMFMFGAEKGKYPLSHNGKGTLRINGGVLVYPEFNLGGGGGIVAKGDAYPLTASYTPISYKRLNGFDYYNKDNGGAEAHLGKWHTMTIAVINKHCYIYIDDYGLMHDFSLGDDYKGGYVSLAASGSTYGFRNLKIQSLKSLSQETIVSAENPRDITTSVGTAISKLNLPSTVKVTLKNGQKVDAKVDWINMNYNPEVEGVYKFTAVVKESASMKNPGSVGVEINVHVVEKVKSQSLSVKEWTFDTNDDLKDFKTTFVKNEEKGYVTDDVPLWFVYESTGNLHRDEFRTVSGSDSANVAVMTYTGAKYKNFELEVDYSWHSTRMMVMFGSEKAGEYINLKDKKSDKNPVAVFVEMEGVVNAIGNVRNTNYYNRTEKMISNARSNSDRIPNYYDKENLAGNIGTMHHMKIRVEGQQLSVWIDDCKEPFVTELSNYDGGYISLVSTTKGGVFDNLKITRLSDNITSKVKENKVVANGTENVTVDTNATTDLVIPEREAPEAFEEIELIKTIPFYLVGGGIVLGTTLIGFLIVLLAWLKRKKGERG